jgi:hypothetical protein
MSTTDTPTRPTSQEWGVLLDRFGTAVFGGMVAGFLVGGVGGRLAMLLLRLTSSDGIRGIESDDGFEIGRFSTETLFLLGATTLVGGMLGVGYLAVRRWLPAAGRRAQAAVFFGLVGGAFVIEPDGVDFTLLDPLWLAVALFVALPAGFGWLLAELAERRLGGEHGLRKSNVAAVIVFVVVGFLGVVPLLLIPIAALCVLAGRRWPGLGAAVDSAPVTWGVRALLLAVAAASAAGLATDVSEIL